MYFLDSALPTVLSTQYTFHNTNYIVHRTQYVHSIQYLLDPAVPTVNKLLPPNNNIRGIKVKKPEDSVNAGAVHPLLAKNMNE